MISYKPLMVLLAERGIRKRDLMLMAGISPNTMTKIRRNEEVSIAILNKIMKALSLTDYSNIMEYIPEQSNTAHR